GNAVALFNAREEAGMTLHLRPSPRHEIRADAALVKLLEAQLERLLRAIPADHGRIVFHPAERPVDRRLGDTARARPPLAILQPGIETASVVAAGCCGDGRRGEQQT